MKASLERYGRWLAASFLLLGCGAEPGSNAPDGQPTEAAGYQTGLHKGDSGPGVRGLYQRLSDLGYFPSEALKRDYPDWIPVIPESPAVEDRFDDVLERGLRAFQRQVGLGETGVVDQPTATALATQSCGFPEYGERDENWKFSVTAPSWNQTNLTWRLTTALPTGTYALTDADFAAMMNGAFNEWNAHSQFTFNRATAGTGEHLSIEFGDPCEGILPTCGFEARAMPPTLAPGTNTVTRWRIIFRSTRDWRPTGTSADWRDLRALALHEIGHTLSLHHSNPPGACTIGNACGPGPIMWYIITAGNFTLREDDIVGVHAKYPGYTNQGRTARYVTAGTDGSVWTLGPNAVWGGYPISRWSASTGWQTVDGAALSIGVQSNGVAWAADDTGQMWVSSIFGWVPASWLSLQGVAAGSDRVWALGTTAVSGEYAIYQWNDSAGDFTVVSGHRAISVAVDRNGTAWALKLNRQVYQRTGSSWTLHSTAPQFANSIRAGANGSLWIITAESTGFGSYIWNQQTANVNADIPAGVGWLRVRSPLASATSTGSSLDIAATPDGRLWSITTNAGAAYNLWRSVR